MNLNIFATRCLRQSNINELVEEVMTRINLTDRSRPKLEQIIVETMKRYLSEIRDAPRSDREALAAKAQLNVIVVEDVYDFIAKKHAKGKAPRQIRQTTGRVLNPDSLAREVSTYGNRTTGSVPRPKHQPKREDVRETRMGFGSLDGGGGCSFAPAFGSYSFVDEQQVQMDLPRGNSDVEQRYQQMLSSRKIEGSQQFQPPSIDLSLDGSGRKQQMQSQMQQPSQPDPYDILLGAGAPSQQFAYTQMQMPQPQGMGPMFQ